MNDQDITKLTISASWPATPYLSRRAIPGKFSPELTQRKYVEESKLISGPEFSARMSYQGQGFYFPLGTFERKLGLSRAKEINHLVATDGWIKAINFFPREITAAIFWTASPCCCTYTTIYTMPNGVPKRLEDNASIHGICRTSLVCADATVARALSHWINRQPGFQADGNFENIADLLSSVTASRSDLILVDRDLIDAPGTITLGQLRRQLPQTKLLKLGIYEESNYIFHSVTGIKTGYILCRRSPRQWMDPAGVLARSPRITSTELELAAKVYFAHLFEANAGRETDQEETLTSREHDVMLQLTRGLSEKQAADKLGISPLTVHNHVKKIYHKLEVHSRTEAVLKYLRPAIS